MCVGHEINKVIAASRRRNRIGNTTELPLAILILFAVLAFPLINLIGLGLACATVWCISFQSALVASTQTDFDTSLSALTQKSGQLNTGGFVNLLKMTPMAGYKDCGTDLYIESVDYVDSSKNQTTGPNLAVPPPILLTNRFYEISAHSNYEVQPFISLSNVPLLNAVPGLGTPVTLSATVKRCAEFPQGLIRGPGGQTGTATNNTLSSGATSFASPIAFVNASEPWNRPTIYNEIDAAGEHVIDHTVALVNADNPDWTDTGIVVKPGQTVWIDFRADGVWGGQKGSYAPTLDADGHDYAPNVGYSPNLINIFGNHYPSVCYNLVGSVDPANPLILAQPYEFNCGKALYKYQPNKTGALKLGFWNYFPAEEGIGGNGIPSINQTQAEKEAFVRAYYAKNNVGAMTVRIIVSQ